MGGTPGGNKSKRAHGDKSAQEWFKKRQTKNQKRRSIAKASKRANWRKK